MDKETSLEPPAGALLEKKGIVLPTGKPGSWEDGMVECPVVWWDENRKQYGMVHTGYQCVVEGKRGYQAVGKPQVGLAWSDDLFHWKKDERSPIFGPGTGAEDYDCSGCSGPFVWVEGGVYYLFYFGTTEAGYEGGRKTLNVATSTDLYNWERFSGNPVIEPEGEGWRNEAIWHPHIQKVEGTYYLFFNASGVVDGHAEEFIGYATSSDLFHWKVEDENCPLLVGSRIPGQWDSSGRTGDPSLYRIGEEWFMAYYSWDLNNTQDGLAMTRAADFPLGWRPYAGNPVLLKGAPGTFDALHAGKPHIFREGNRHFHFYTAVDQSQHRQIALAVYPRTL
jgi:predicted GH43/DUF377 family glycosyl hydrolase